MRARLALEGGLVLGGRSVGAGGWAGGEVVFTTAMTGYQEVLSDPSYRGQIVTMAYPLIGNYGIGPEAWESYRPHVAGFVVSEAAGRPHHWRCTPADLVPFLRNPVSSTTRIAAGSAKCSRT